MHIKKLNKTLLGNKYIFIFGFPGSGTTILSKQLSLNLDASLWLEPYYIWRKWIKEKNYDNFNSKAFSDKIINEIRKDFFKFYIKSNKNFLIEKEPRNIFNFLIIKKIFPYSKFIFIKKKNLKDNLETILRKTNTRKKKNKWSDLRDIYYKIKNQNFFIFRIKLILYELKNLDRINEYFKKYLNFGTVRWGIKYKTNNKIIYSDNLKDYLFLYNKFKTDLKKLDKKMYINIDLENFGLNFDKEMEKMTIFLGKKNFKNQKKLIDIKRIRNKKK